MRAGEERQRLVQVGAELVGRAGLAGIVAGDRQAAADRLARALEPADVVPLPAVQRDRDGRQPLEGRLDVDAPFRVLLLRLGEGVFHVRAGRGHEHASEKDPNIPGSNPRQFCLERRSPHACQRLGRASR